MTRRISWYINSRSKLVWWMYFYSGLISRPQKEISIMSLYYFVKPERMSFSYRLACTNRPLKSGVLMKNCLYRCSMYKKRNSLWDLSWESTVQGRGTPWGIWFLRCTFPCLSHRLHSTLEVPVCSPEYNGDRTSEQKEQTTNVVHWKMFGVPTQTWTWRTLRVQVENIFTTT